MKRGTLVLAVSAAVTASALGTGALAGAAPAPSVTVTPRVTNLNAPRGITFDPQGRMYVAESGQWLGNPNAPGGPTGAGVTMTGALDKYAGVARASGTPARVWRTPLTSLYDTTNGPEVLGPEGVSASSPTCRVAGRVRRCGVLTIMSESRAGFAKANPGQPVPQQLGQLLALDRRTGAVRGSLSNAGDQGYAFTGAHPELDPGGQFPDANPYDVLVTRGATYVVDAGANTVSRVLPSGRLRVLAYIPNDAVSDSTPTCVTQGPDGALYVGTLNLLLNSNLSTTPPGIGQNPGHSDVWRINPRTRQDFLHAAHRWATGLTTVTACTFDRSGNFWAAEMFQPNTNAAPGDIARIPFRTPTTIQRFGGGQLPLPGGIVQGPDGAVYVTTGSADVTPNAGAVARVTLGG